MGLWQEAGIAPDLREFEPVVAAVVKREEEKTLVGAADNAQPVLPRFQYSQRAMSSRSPQSCFPPK